MANIDVGDRGRILLRSGDPALEVRVGQTLIQRLWSVYQSMRCWGWGWSIESLSTSSNRLGPFCSRQMQRRQWILGQRAHTASI